MNNPIFSFIFSLLIWLVVVMSFSFFAVNNNIELHSEVAIDAEMIGDLVEEKVAASSKEKSEDVVEEHDKISDLKKRKTKKKTIHHDHHYENDQKIKSQSPNILHRPLPQIPSSLRKEAFKTKAIVRFYVDRDGSVNRFEFIKSASNPKLNFLLMKQLKNWKFEPQDEDFTLDVNVAFEVK